MDENRGRLSKLAVWGLSFGYAVGWGAFVLPGTEFLPSAGPLGSFIGIVIGALAMLIIGWNYYSMVVMEPGPGGAYAYARRAFGIDYGFFTAWSISLAYMAILWANATALVLLVRYMFGDVLQFGWHTKIAGFDVYLGESLLPVAAMVLAAGVCIWRRRLAGRVQAALALLMFAGVATCLFFAISRHEGGLATMVPAFAPRDAKLLTQILGVLAMMPWAFVGFEAVSHSSAEFSFPVKHLWRVLVAAIVASAAMYIMLMLLPVLSHPAGFASWPEFLSGSRGLAGLNSMPAFASVREAMGDGGVALLGTTMLAALLTGLIASIVVMSHLLYALSADRLIPKWRWIGRLDANGTPRNAIIFVVGCSLVIPFFGRTVVGWPVEVSSIGAAVAYCVTSAAAFKFARQRADKLTQITGALGVVMAIIMCLMQYVPNYVLGTTLSAESYLVLALWCIVGFVVYWHAFKKDAHERIGLSTVVWAGIVILISLSSLMWVRLATQRSATRAVGSIVEYSARHCAQYHGTTNVGALHDEEGFVNNQMDTMRAECLGFDIVQMALLAVSLVIMFSLYAIQRRREEELKLAQTKAEARDQAKSLFFSTVSHDIRTPLNAIVGFSEMLQHGFDTEEERELAVNSILVSSRTLQQLVNDILDLSKLESGRMDITLEPTDVASLVREIAVSFGAMHQKPGLEILCRVTGTPPLMIDPHRLRQMVYNFMGNAIKFTEKGFIEIRTSFTPAMSGGDTGEFRLEVEDTGCGISEADQKKLAMPFVQVGHASSRRAGTGLGLHICRQLARAMGGDLHISSTLGKGTTFSVIIPGVRLATAQHTAVPVAEDATRTLPKTAPAAEAPAKGEATAKPAHTSFRLLVVDDTMLNHIVLRAMFFRLGVTDITFANNGLEALHILKDPAVAPFDIVLTDLIMPQMSGDELVAAVRANPDLASNRVYLFTAEVEKKDTYLKDGFDGILLKPANLDSLRKLLAENK